VVLGVGNWLTDESNSSEEDWMAEVLVLVSKLFKLFILALVGLPLFLIGSWYVHLVPFLKHWLQKLDLRSHLILRLRQLSQARGAKEGFEVNSIKFLELGLEGDKFEGASLVIGDI
jgi:hypothetical protein